jgi:hypothetical protein
MNRSFDRGQDMMHQYGAPSRVLLRERSLDRADVLFDVSGDRTGLACIPISHFLSAAAGVRRQPAL